MLYNIQWVNPVSMNNIGLCLKMVYFSECERQMIRSFCLIFLFKKLKYYFKLKQVWILHPWCKKQNWYDFRNFRLTAGCLKLHSSDLLGLGRSTLFSNYGDISGKVWEVVVGFGKGKFNVLCVCLFYYDCRGQTFDFFYYGHDNYSILILYDP